MRKTIDQWFSLYSESHQNKINKTIHWICVPTITWTVIAMLWSVNVSDLQWLNLGVGFIAFAILFYLRLSLSLALGMLIFAGICLGLIALHSQYASIALWQTALSLFVIAWIGQFIGHKIEGKKPSFFEDLQFLLIGPAWLMGFIYKRLGIAV